MRRCPVLPTVLCQQLQVRCSMCTHKMRARGGHVVLPARCQAEAAADAASAAVVAELEQESSSLGTAQVPPGTTPSMADEEVALLMAAVAAGMERDCDWMVRCWRRFSSVPLISASWCGCSLSKQQMAATAVTCTPCIHAGRAAAGARRSVAVAGQPARGAGRRGDALAATAVHRRCGGVRAHCCWRGACSWRAGRCMTVLHQTREAGGRCVELCRVCCCWSSTLACNGPCRRHGLQHAGAVADVCVCVCGGGAAVPATASTRLASTLASRR